MKLFYGTLFLLFVSLSHAGTPVPQTLIDQVADSKLFTKPFDPLGLI